ncbi:MAG: hypothetical protein DMG56_27880, partial [Acidobacteria bacterium]
PPQDAAAHSTTVDTEQAEAHGGPKIAERLYCPTMGRERREWFSLRITVTGKAYRGREQRTDIPA